MNAVIGICFDGIKTAKRDTQHKLGVWGSFLEEMLPCLRLEWVTV